MIFFQFAAVRALFLRRLLFRLDAEKSSLPRSEQIIINYYKQIIFIFKFYTLCLFQCRNNVHRLSKNHRINNLIEAYLKEHPNKKRSDEELKELDLKNKITKDMVRFLLSDSKYLD